MLTLPTGNADDFLGFHDPTFTPWLIVSKTFGRVSPHVNVGYSIRSERGRQPVPVDRRRRPADHALADAGLRLPRLLRPREPTTSCSRPVGFKVNPIGGLVVSVGFQFPVNRDGLRADVIYTGQVEYNF